MIVLDKPEKDGRIYYAVSPQALSDENECTKTAAAPGYDYASTSPVTVRKLLISIVTGNLALYIRTVSYNTYSCTYIKVT